MLALQSEPQQVKLLVSEVPYIGPIVTSGQTDPSVPVPVVPIDPEEVLKQMRAIA